MRRLRLLVASVFALLALGAMPADSRAETGPQWFSEGKLLAAEPVRVEGQITGFELNFIPSERESEYYCNARNTLRISNPPGGGPGIDEMVSFRLTGCTPVRYPGPCEFLVKRVIALGLPWRGHLAVEPSGHVINVFEGVTLELTCNKSRGAFSGLLHPEIIGGSLLEFGGAGVLSGALGQVELYYGKEFLRHGRKKITVA